MLCHRRRTLEVRLQGYVDADVRGDVVTLDGGGAACAPLTGQVEVVGALATDVALAYVILDVLSASCKSCDEEGTRSPREKTSTRCVHGFPRRQRRLVEGPCRGITYIKSFGTVAALAAALPLTGQVVNC
jgi:hypothetical protein